MRFSLLVMLIVCLAGFLGSSGAIALQGGSLRLNSDAVTQSLPVLIALATPMLIMGLVLVVTMTLGRESRRRGARSV